MGIDYAHFTGDRFREVKKSGPDLVANPVRISRLQVQCSSQREAWAGLVPSHLKMVMAGPGCRGRPEAG